MTHLDEQGAMQTRETMISDLSALPSSPVSELVLRLRSEAAQFSGRDFKSIFDTCTEAAHALSTLSTRNAELEREVKRLREALERIDGLEVMEINPSNYSHEDVCELNNNAIQAALIANAALYRPALSTSPQGGEHE